MALPYKKWTDEEIKNRNLSPEGQYPFRIVSAVKKPTKVKLDNSGQPKEPYHMLELELEFHDVNGVVKKQRDWIVFAEGMDWKLRHLASTTSLLMLYDDNELDAVHLTNKNGVMVLGIRDDEYKGEKRKVNFVKDYVKKEFIDDDITF